MLYGGASSQDIYIEYPCRSTTIYYDGPFRDGFNSGYKELRDGALRQFDID